MKINELFNVDHEDLYPALIRRSTLAKKQRNVTAYIYYTDAARQVANGELSGCANFEDFIGSWAGHNWLKKNKERIEEFAAEERSRFGIKWIVN